MNSQQFAIIEFKAIHRCSILKYLKKIKKYNRKYDLVLQEIREKREKLSFQFKKRLILKCQSAKKIGTTAVSKRNRTVSDGQNGLSRNFINFFVTKNQS